MKQLYTVCRHCQATEYNGLVSSHLTHSEANERGEKLVSQADEFPL